MPETLTQPIPTEAPEAPICATQKCKRPLTRLGPPRNCWRCLVCNPIVEAKKTESRKRRDIDKQLSEERVLELIKNTTAGLDEEAIREIIQDELQNWFIQKPPITKEEILAETTPTPSEPPEQTWRQEAKDLGVPLHKEPAGSGMRKKVEVLADIEAARFGGTEKELLENIEKFDKAKLETRSVPVDGGY